MNHESNVPGYKKYLDMNKYYVILVPLNETAEDDMYRYEYLDNNHKIKPDFLSMTFHEDTFCLLESYLFNFIDKECDLSINMYEEEIAELEQLPKILEITERMINNSDDKEFIKLAEEFKSLVSKAIDFKTCVGFYF